jgi:hypothetical protein
VSKVAHSAFIPLSNVWTFAPDGSLHFLIGFGVTSICAQRMMDAAQSKASKDLREILPGVLGFSGKRGRGHPLRPDGEASEYVTAAVVFANAIDKGSKPTDALNEASMVLHRPVADKIDHKTLLGHIKKLYDVTKAPRTNAGWKTLLRAWYLEKFLSGNYIANYRRVLKASSD